MIKYLLSFETPVIAAMIYKNIRIFTVTNLATKNSKSLYKFSTRQILSYI